MTRPSVSSTNRIYQPLASRATHMSSEREAPACKAACRETACPLKSARKDMACMHKRHIHVLYSFETKVPLKRGGWTELLSFDKRLVRQADPKSNVITMRRMPQCTRRRTDTDPLRPHHPSPQPSSSAMACRTLFCAGKGWKLVMAHTPGSSA